jgi:hypothetical protein
VETPVFCPGISVAELLSFTALSAEGEVVYHDSLINAIMFAFAK